MIRLKETKYHQERLEREVVRGGGGGGGMCQGEGMGIMTYDPTHHLWY